VRTTGEDNIFHASIAAMDPQHVAEVVAELWGGEAMEFLLLNNGSVLSADAVKAIGAREG